MRQILVFAASGLSSVQLAERRTQDERDAGGAGSFWPREAGDRSWWTTAAGDSRGSWTGKSQRGDPRVLFSDGPLATPGTDSREPR